VPGACRGAVPEPSIMRRSDPNGTAATTRACGRSRQLVIVVQGRRSEFIRVLRHITNLPGGEVRDRARKASFRFFPGEVETGEPSLSDHRVVKLP